MARFLRYLSVISVLLLAAVAALNRVVDPSGYFHLRAGRAEEVHHTVAADPRFAKPMGAALSDPDTVIAGTSRVARGFSARAVRGAPAWGRTYNLGIPGMRMAPLADRLRTGLAGPHLKRLVLALDYGMFLGEAETRGQPARIPVRPLSEAVSLGEWADDVRILLLSKPMLSASGRALTDGGAEANRADLLGFPLGEKFPALAARLGHRRMAQRLEGRLRTLWLAGTDPLDDAYPRHIQALSELLAQACRRGIRVEAFVNPFHVRQLALLSRLGLFEAHVAWRKDLLRVFAPHVQSGCALPLMDFSGVNGPNAEAFPALGDRRTRMWGWWESTHYTDALGERVLRRLAHRAGPVPDGFGRELDLAELNRMGLDWARFREENPEAFEDVPGR